MKKEEISYKVREIVAQKMSAKDLQEFLDSEGNSIIRENNLQDDLGIDSLDKVEVIMLIEKDMKIDIEMDIYKGILTVGDLEDAVMAKLA